MRSKAAHAPFLGCAAMLMQGGDTIDHEDECAVSQGQLPRETARVGKR
jgi:hypothetical protein